MIAPTYFWDKVDKQFTIEIPETMTGQVSIHENEEEIANVTVTNGKATFKLDLEKGFHELDFYWQGDEDIEFDRKYMEVMSDSPSWNMEVKSDAVLKTHAYLYLENRPEYFTGNFILTIDGKEFKVNDEGSELYFDAKELAIGKHNYTLSFTDEGYYMPTSTSGSFELDNMDVRFPDEYVLADTTGEKESVIAILPDDATGKVTFTVNGKTIKSVDLQDEFPDYTFDIYCDIPRENIKLNATNTITVKLVDEKYKTITKTAKIFATYELATTSQVVYGEHLAELFLPYDLNVSKITATIDGKKYEVIKDSDDYFFLKTTTNLGIGNHSVILTYSGDEKFPTLTKTSNMEVIGEIDYANNYDNTYVFIEMPKNAKGNLTVTLNGEEYASVKAAGKVNISLNDLKWGRSELKAEYTGDDYDIKSIDDTITVIPPYRAPSKLLARTTDSISVNLTGITGRLNIWTDDFDREAELENGFASIDLPTLPVGENWIDAEFTRTFINDEGEEDADSYSWSFKIKVINPIAAKDTIVVYSANGKYNVNIKDIDGNPVKSGKSHILHNGRQKTDYEKDQ